MKRNLRDCLQSPISLTSEEAPPSLFSPEGGARGSFHLSLEKPPPCQLVSPSPVRRYIPRPRPLPEEERESDRHQPQIRALDGLLGC